MNSESEIQAEIESLKERFTETKALYREVCALLFFRHGITPTASATLSATRSSMNRLPPSGSAGPSVTVVAARATTPRVARRRVNGAGCRKTMRAFWEAPAGAA